MGIIGKRDIMKVKQNTRHKFWWSSIVILTLTKYLLTNGLPLYAIVNAYYDDELMMRLSNSIMRGEWLGAYGKRTLVKECMFPVFMALIRYLGLSYSYAVITLYIFSCIIFCLAINKFIHNDKFILLLYIVLLFNPASMDLSSYQRIYRCSISPAQVLLIFACFFALYYEVCVQTQRGRREILQKAFWGILAGISLTFFVYSREDSIWVIPFVTVITITGIVLTISKIKVMTHYNFALNVFLLLTPIILLLLGTITISSINKYYYDVYLTNELSGSSFADCIKSIYSVKNDDEMRRITNPRTKIQKLYEVSPTLRSISGSLEQVLDNWDLSDRNPGDGEVENGWFTWALRDAVDLAGYYSSAQSAADFYDAVAKEINEASANGLVETQATMPNALMPPWRSSQTRDFCDAILKSIVFVFNFEETDAFLVMNDKYEMNQYLAEYYEFTNVTNNYFLENATKIRIRGWAFLENSMDDISIELVSKESGDTIILPRQSSMDVYAHFEEEGQITTPIMSKCRFSCDIICNPKDKYYLKFITPSSSNNYISEEGDVHMEESSIRYVIDEFIRYEEGNYTSINKWAVDTVNNISSVYRSCNGIIGMLSIIMYLIIWGYNVCAIKKGKYTIEYWNELMIPSALLASLFVLIIGVSYMEEYSFGAISSLYYSGAYSLVLSFEMLSMFFVARRIKAAYKYSVHEV